MNFVYQLWYYVYVYKMDAKHVVVSVEFACLNCGYMKLYWFLLKLMKSDFLVLIVDELMVKWCYCCCEMLLLLIYAMGIHNYEVLVWIELLLRVLVKNGYIDELCWNVVWFQVWYGFDCLFMYINI